MTLSGSWLVRSCPNKPNLIRSLIFFSSDKRFQNSAKCPKVWRFSRSWNWFYSNVIYHRATLITDIPFSALVKWRNWSFWKIKRTDDIFTSWILRTCPNKLENIILLIIFSSDQVVQNLGLISAYKLCMTSFFPSEPYLTC